MKWMGLLGVALVLTLALAGCGGSGGSSAADQKLQHEADVNAIDQLEKIWHKAASTKNVDLMMSIWAQNATFNVGTDTYTGRAEIRDFFAHKAGPFEAGNNWASETPAYKIRITVNGDKGTLYFQCVYVDRKTSKVVSVVSADQDVRRINGRWLMTRSVAAPATL
jgi:ketosteroid isomerase-like protein